MRCLIRGIWFWGLFCGSVSYAAGSLQQSVIEQAALVEVSARSVSFENAGKRIGITGYAVGYSRYLVPKAGFFGEIAQLYGKSGGKNSALVTSITFGGRFRPLASHSMVKESIVADGSDFITTSYSRGIQPYLLMGVTQQMINSATGILPYNGLTYGAGVDVPVAENWVGQFCINQATASNDKATIKITTMSFGAAYAI
jgi:hypothetical protein